MNPSLIARAYFSYTIDTDLAIVDDICTALEHGERVLLQYGMGFTLISQEISTA